MPYTFGNTVNDDITWGAGLAIAQGGVTSSTITLVTGWWRPTTLTATRGLWSAGNTIGAEIDTTTDELRLRTDNTTDGQWTTTGVDMAVNNWYYLAFLLSTNASTGAAWRVWRATPDTPPVEVTVTVAVALSGAFTSNATFYIGNKGTGALSFQGQVANVAVLNQGGGSTPSNRPPMFVNAYGTISQEQADRIRDLYVIPHWQGDYTVPRPGSNVNGDGECFWLNTLDQGAAVHGWRTQTYTANYPAVTINGATFTQAGAPRVARLLPRPHVCCTGL
jgi:hypothetical protein